MRPAWIFVVPVLLLAALLGMQLISADALWIDEWYSYYFTGGGEFLATTVEGSPCEALPGETQTVLHMLCLVVVVDTWPPLHNALLMAWDLISQGLLVIDRYLSLLIGLLAIAMTYRFAADLINQRAGILAALLIGSSAFYIHYLHELRGYTLFVLCCATVGWTYWKLLNARNPSRWLRWAFSLSVAAALYTHFVSIALIGGLAIYHLGFERPRRLMQEPDTRQQRRARWILILRAGLNGILLYAPWAAFLLVTFMKEADVSRSRGIGQILGEFLFISPNGHWLLGGVLLAGSLLAFRLRPVRFLWIWVSLSLLLLAFGDRVADVLFHPRHILGFLPLILTMMAFTLDKAIERAPAISYGVIGVWIGVGIVSSGSFEFINQLPSQFPPTSLTAVETMRQLASECGQPDDALILGMDVPEEEWLYDATTLYYFGRYAMRVATYSRLLSDREVSLRPSQLLPLDAQTHGVQGRLDYLTANAERVFVVARQDRPLITSTMEVDDLLTERGYRQCGPAFENAELFGLVYGRTPDICAQVAANCGLFSGIPSS